VRRGSIHSWCKCAPRRRLRRSFRAKLGVGSIGRGIRAIPRGAPIKVLTVSLRRPVFWLVTRPELKTFADLKGKVLGTTTLGGSQHTAGVRMLRRAGLNPDKDVTVVLGGDVPTQLQALVNGSIQVGILSPPMVIVARAKYKMNILASAIDEFTSLQNGVGVLEKNVKDPVIKKILRARAKGNRYFHRNEKGTADILAKYLNVDVNTAHETYRISRGDFTTDGIPTDEELTEYLKADAQILGLPAAVPVAKVFDFSCNAKSITNWGQNERRKKSNRGLWRRLFLVHRGGIR
jgi:ABC-type nitrate/sulfonate/bicarbonate transport system substrate-binding protein